MDLNAVKDRLVLLGEAATAVGIIGTAIIWLMREKVGAWVDGRVTSAVVPLQQAAAEATAATEAWRESLEERMSDQEKVAERIAQALEHISEKFRETTERQTIAMEKISEKLDDTAVMVQRIDATIERRETPRHR